MASLFNLIMTLLKKFSVGLRSGIRASILKTLPSTLSVARIAVFEFWRGHPSLRNRLAFGFAEFLKAFLEQHFTIAANLLPVIGPPHCSHRTTPLP